MFNALCWAIIAVAFAYPIDKSPGPAWVVLGAMFMAEVNVTMALVKTAEAPCAD